MTLYIFFCPLLQIIFDSFTVGRFDEGMVDTDVDGYETSLSPTGELPGCPEGFMQVSYSFFLYFYIFY